MRISRSPWTQRFETTGMPEIAQELGTSEEEIEEKLEKMGIKWSGEDEDEDKDEIKGTGARYPNLKYAKPKYRNLESVLKYADGNPVQGLKLVIMNFND